MHHKRLRRQSLWSKLSNDCIVVEHLVQLFYIGNGTKQGGILSPYLIPIYQLHLSAATYDIYE